MGEHAVVEVGGLDVDRTWKGGASCNWEGECWEKRGDNDEDEDVNAFSREGVCTMHLHESEKTQHQRVMVDRR